MNTTIYKVIKVRRFLFLEKSEPLDEQGNEGGFFVGT